MCESNFLVSIITVSYNSESTIARTIESVLNQTYQQLEYIIVDGCSTDRTVEIANSYKRKMEEKGYKFIVISEPDKGMYDALNKGALLANGVLVGQINADDWYETNAVELMVGLYSKENYDTAWGSIRIIKRKGTMIKHAKVGKLWTTTHWCHPSMFSRKDILLQFPYALESMYDDFDFITAVKCAGKKIVTKDVVISNYSFGLGGQSTKKGLKEVKRRIKIVCKIYRKYGMSRLYFFHRLLIELIKVFENN